MLRSQTKKVGDDIQWFDITGKEDFLREMGIDPGKALTELHVRDKDNNILTEIDAYTLLLNKFKILKPLTWAINLPVVRPVLSKIYHLRVNRRLQQSGRLDE